MQANTNREPTALNSACCDQLYATVLMRWPSNMVTNAVAPAKPSGAASYMMAASTRLRSPDEPIVSAAER